MDGHLLHNSAEELVSAHGIGRIPATRGFDVLPVTLRTPVHKFAIGVSHLRDSLLQQSHLEAVVQHRAVLSREKLQDHVLPAREDTRHSADAAELADLEHPAVHVFQEREVVAVACDVARRAIVVEMLALRYLAENTLHRFRTDRTKNEKYLLTLRNIDCNLNDFNTLATHVRRFDLLRVAGDTATVCLTRLIHAIYFTLKSYTCV